jgi:CO dehydrogenase maturation factor
MEAGIEHLGRSTVSGVDTLLVVVEPGQRSLESARRIRQMAHDIGLDKIKYIANKVTGSGDEAFIRKALPEGDIIGVIPYNDTLRRIDRDGMSVIDGMDKALYATFENMLDKLIDISKH